MGRMTDEERESAVTVYPAGYLDFENQETDPYLLEQQKEFDKFREEMADSTEEATITVSRQPTDDRGRPIGKKLFQCFSCGVDDYTFPQLCNIIRDDYGTGLYRIQGRDSKGKYQFNKSIGIQAPKKERAENGDGSSAGEVIDRMATAFERQQARMDEMFNRMQGPMANPLSQIEQIAGLMHKLMPQPKSLASEMKEMMMMQEFMHKFSGSNGSGGDDNIYSLLRSTVENFGPLLGAALAAGQKSGNVDDDGIIKDQKQLAAPKQENATVETYKENLLFLVKQAKGGASPSAVAAFVLDAIEDNPETVENLEEFLTRPDYLQTSIAVVPAVGDHAVWFDHFRNAMLKKIAQYFESESEPAGLTAPDESVENAPTDAGAQETKPDDGTDKRHVASDPKRESGN